MIEWTRDATTTRDRSRVVVLGDGLDRAVADALADRSDTVVESVAASERDTSTIAGADCAVFAPPLASEGDHLAGTDGEKDDDRSPASPSPADVLADLVEGDDDVPVLVYADSSALDAPTAFEAGATDHVDTRRPDAAVVLRRRIDAVLRDRRRERSERETRRLLEAVFDNAPVHLYVKDPEGRHLFVTEAYIRDRTEYLGLTDREIYPDAHSDETYEDDLHVVETATPILHKIERVLDTTDERFSYRNLRRRYDRVLNDDAPDTVAHDVEWVLTSKVPWIENGDVVGLIGVGIDVTERERARRRLRRQTDRLSRFAGVVSHDLRTPLSTAQGNLSLFRDSGDESYLARVERAHGRMARFIESVLDLARQGRVVDDPESVPLDRPVLAAWRDVDTADATLVRVGDPTPEAPSASRDADDADWCLDRIAADEHRLRELFENLFRNAVEHGSTGSRTAEQSDDAVERGSTSPRSRTREDGVEHGAADRRPAAGPVIRVGRRDDGGFYVSDDGPGIAPEERERVLEWGYTTTAGGTGLGLGIVDAVAGAHGWRVSVGESDVGGVRFDFVPDLRRED